MTTVATISPYIDEPREGFMKRCMSSGNGREVCEVAFKPEAIKQKTWRKIDKQRDEHLNKQRKRIEKAIQDGFAKTVEVISQSGPSVEMVDEASDESVRNALQNLWQDVSLDFAKKEYDNVLAQKGIRRWGVLKEVDEELLESFVLEAVRDHTDEAIALMSKSIISTAKPQVKRAIKDAIDAGDGPDEAATRVRRVINGVSQKRARVIARTEIVSAQNWGGRQGAIATGVDVWKEWLATRDGRTRTFNDGPFSHVAADGERKEANIPFENTGESVNYPGDVNASVANRANCRCAETHVPKNV